MLKQKTSAKIVLFTILFMLLFSFITPMKVSAAPSKGDGKTTGDINSVGASIEDGELKFQGDMSKGSDSDGTWTNILDKYKGFIVGVAGIGTITMIAVFIMNFMKLGTTAGNPQERQKVIHGLVYSGLAAAGLGSVTTFVALFYYLLR